MRSNGGGSTLLPNPQIKRGKGGEARFSVQDRNNIFGLPLECPLKNAMTIRDEYKTYRRRRVCYALEPGCFWKPPFPFISKSLATPIFVFYYHDILRQHVNAATRVGRTRMARSVDAGGFEGVDTVEMAAYQSVWNVCAQYG